MFVFNQVIDSCPQGLSVEPTWRSRRRDGIAGTRLKTFGGKNKTDDIYIHGRCSHRQSHRGVCRRRRKKNKNKSKTAHVKAKERSHPSYIHSSVQACTQTHTEGHIYIKCTRVFGQSVRLKPTLTTVNPNNMFKRNRGGWKSSHPRMTAAGRELLTWNVRSERHPGTNDLRWQSGWLPFPWLHWSK